MLFDIEHDDGSVVRGWVALDHPEAEPSILVDLADGRRYRFHALLPRPDIDAAYRRTGKGARGFFVAPPLFPGLGPGDPLALYEERSSTLLFRRQRGGTLPRRHFHLAAETGGEALFGPHSHRFFAMAYGSAELIGEETLSSILRLSVSSLLVTGSPLLRRVGPDLAAGGFSRSVLLRDPLRELAATIVRLRRLGSETGPAADGWRSLGQAGLIRSFSGPDTLDRSVLARIIRDLDDEDAMALADPLTRRLAARDMSEPLGHDLVVAALDALAEFDVLGFEDAWPDFARDMTALFGRDPGLREPDDPPGLAAVLAALRRCAPAADLVELDREVVSRARQAVQE